MVRPRAGRTPSPIPDPDSPLGRLAGYLRGLREQAGDPSFEALSYETKRTGRGYSQSSLRSAATGKVLPTLDVAEAFVRACVDYAQTNPELAHSATRDWVAKELVGEVVRYYQNAAHHSALPGQPAQASGTSAPKSSTSAAASNDATSADEEPGPATPGSVSPLPEPERSGAKALRRRRRLALTAIAAALVAVTVLAASNLVDHADQAGASPGSSTTPPGPEPAAENTRRAPEPARTPTDGGTVLAGRSQCRGASPKGPATINPCISVTGDALHYLVRVTAQEPISDLAIHVWLIDVTTGQRLTNTLRYCQATLIAVDQTAECGPATTRPEPGHHYVAAADITVGHVEQPPLWKNPGATGLSTAGVLWPPPTR
ncbi:hypothetical protein [Amycolatopsis taiwanensis]|uniref:Uncharacterized protein n=1 Tax=Amycolatopsis taiwanensis TaxID=342230 RepID=A0A9W6R7C9_9PSEU|nr:hypothetical protein [Amycolatopsis taiwanensis]GLY70744.1 hypothetical protein Atai01_73630 [Amycolatopsis taiwanensis]